ncbi:MAG: peroxide stress protein YaaA [Sulfurovum sp.]
MKILFSPSEAKYRGGINKPIESKNYIFPELFGKRLEILKRYQDYIDNSSKEQLMKLFGTKKEDIVDYYSSDIFARETQKVIERYDGVAYDYLDYSSLDDIQKRYIEKNTLIFSNLFGAILAGDKGLPDYKLKQGEKIGDLALEKFYKEHFTPSIDKFLEDEDCLDLRAGFYTKFYKPSKNYTTLKFIKDGKVVSHWAKAYRGVVLRHLAIYNIDSVEELLDTTIEKLSIKDINIKGFHQEVIYEIN